MGGNGMSSGPEPVSPDPAAMRAQDDRDAWNPDVDGTTPASPGAEPAHRAFTAGAANAQCDAEPIHIPGGIQPHGYLLCLSSTLTIIQASENVGTLVGCPVEQLLGEPVDVVIGAAAAARVAHAAATAMLDETPLYVGVMENPFFSPREGVQDHLAAAVDGPELDITMHRHDGNLIVELEVARHSNADVFASMYPLVRTFTRSLQDVETLTELGDLAVREVRAMTGFGRVLLYKFDDEGRSQVLSEHIEDGYASFLNQLFPASDIPRQARALYVKQRVRLVANAQAKAARLVPAMNPATGRPTDLSYAALRSFSPIHLEYMRNMGTYASMSVSLVVRGQLWGLISCHDHDARLVPFEVRVAIEHLGQIVSLQIEAKEERAETAYLLRLRRTMSRLMGSLAEQDDYLSALKSAPDDLLCFAGSTGAAIVVDGKATLIGSTPDQDTVLALSQWLSSSTSGVYATDALSQAWPRASRHTDTASGILAVPISQIFRNYVIWFRPETTRTITWAGEPVKRVSSQNGSVAPRKDFAPWLETVRNRSIRWHAVELEIAGEFRLGMLNIVLRHAEGLAELANELRRTNKELEAFSYSVSHDLRAPLRHIAGYGDLLRESDGDKLSERSKRFLHNMLESARFAGVLVDDLLTFSQMGRAALRPVSVDLNQLVRSVAQEFGAETANRKVEWIIPELPTVTGDPAFLQIALRNLFSNAVKYTRTRESARIELSAQSTADEYIVSVRDNGVGFNMKYVNKLFGVFQRLHRAEEFDGTGIGLANVRRIIERHDGRTWAEGREGEGAAFHFSLPKVFRAEATETEPGAGKLLNPTPPTPPAPPAPQN
ncbi:Phytochrome, two-component sensor histidine kinase [Caballeronia sordidicola]|jgi:chemotaxis family two-component system sensor kinase Cph1|uniref:histidine kinase n=2 Tax=Caballeronia sordidicola TaxID=196367 RepID=A0A226WTX5_CABSO|nr:Phytochrome, two-component sensor histidine kinase [Caballeronia sordidicola]